MMLKGKIKLGFFAVILLATACGSPEKEIHGDKEYVSTYICPMHCDGSGAAKKGTCPVCDRKYMENDLYGHAEEIVYEDHQDSY